MDRKKLNLKQILLLVTGMIIIAIFCFVYYQRQHIHLKNQGVYTLEVGTKLDFQAKDYFDLNFFTSAEREKINQKIKVNFQDLTYLDQQKEFINIGKYQGVITYQNKTYSIKLIVQDTTPPEIEYDDKIAYQQADFDINQYIQVIDNSTGKCQIDIQTQNLDINQLGEYTITVKASDASGNQVTQNIKMHVVDKEAPVLSHVEDKILQIGESFLPLKDVSAKDNVDGNITNQIQVKGQVDTNKKGIYTVLYSVQDQAKNQTQKERQIYVIDSSYLIKEVPMILQNPGYYNGCEAASSTMLLQYYGYHYKMAEVVKSIPTIPLQRHNGRLYGANPNEAFTGSMVHEGYGIYTKPMVDVVNRLISKKEGKHQVRSLIGESVEKLLYEVSEGHPVQIWATASMMNVKYSGTKSWYIKTRAGKYTDEQYHFPLSEHCMLLVGYDKNNVIINDPLRGQVRYSIKAFREAFESMGAQALMIENKK